MWMFRLWLEREKIDDIDKAKLKVRKMLIQNGGRCQGLRCRDITSTGKHHIRFAFHICACPVPDPNALGTMQNGLFHGQVLEVRLFIRDDDVDVVSAAQTMVGYR